MTLSLKVYNDDKIQNKCFVDFFQTGIKACPMILVFGCRQSQMDHIYKEETIQAKNKEVFKELYTAYSREPGRPKVKIWTNTEEFSQAWEI